MTETTFHIKLSQVQKFAQKLAKKLRGGEVLALIGELGSGKTTFTQALGAALGVQHKILSPTFVVMQEFKTEQGLYLYHLDLYRTATFKEVEALGITQWWQHPETITVIEWADRIQQDLPPKTLYIYLTRD